MAQGLILEFDGVGRDVYDAVNAKLGIDTTSPSSDWPEGLRYHAAGETGSGFVVFEVWDSQEAQGAFMRDRLGASLHDGGAPEPARVTWIDLAAATAVS